MRLLPIAANIPETVRPSSVSNDGRVVEIVIRVATMRTLKTCAYRMHDPYCNLWETHAMRLDAGPAIFPIHPSSLILHP